MPRTLADAVRWPLDADEFRLRLSDRAVARLPAVATRLWRTAIEQPPGSRLRRWLVTRVLTAGWAAYDAKDWDFLGQFYAPDVVATVSGDVLFDWGTTRGWAETQARLEQTYDAVVGETRPFEVIDPGGPFAAVRLDTEFTGQASGISLKREITVIYEIGAGGRVVRQLTSPDPDEIDAWLRSAEGGS
jgi:hypothetical protein